MFEFFPAKPPLKRPSGHADGPAKCIRSMMQYVLSRRSLTLLNTMARRLSKRGNSVI